MNPTPTPKNSLLEPQKVKKKNSTTHGFSGNQRLRTISHTSGKSIRKARNEFRHLKVLDLLDEDGVKPLETLKDELGLLKLHYLSYAYLVQVISNMEKVYP